MIEKIFNAKTIEIEEQISMMNLVKLQKSIEKDLIPALLGVVESAKYINKHEISPFEESLINYCGKDYAVGVGSCTDALYIALKAYGIGSGDEVISVPNSFYATSEAILRCGAKPVMVDIDENTLLMDISKLQKLINDKTKAIMPVHIYGNVVDVEKINDVLQTIDRPDIIIVEDCAHAFGSKLRGKLTPIGECGAFSFNPGKNCGAFSDAGAVITSNKEIAQKAKLLRDHGRKNKNTHVVVGLNSRLSAINDSILRVKMGYIEQWNRRRREIASFYINEFKELTNVKTIIINKDIESAYHQFVIMVENRDELIRFLYQNKITTDLHYPVLIPFQPVFNGIFDERIKIPVAEKIGKKILSIPCYPELSDIEVNYIAAKIKEFY